LLRNTYKVRENTILKDGLIKQKQLIKQI
jgi:hypothetical protein